MSQRPSETNFIHQMGSADIVYPDSINIKIIGPYLLGDMIGKGTPQACSYFRCFWKS
jgi:hypothetical protein